MLLPPNPAPAHGQPASPSAGEGEQRWAMENRRALMGLREKIENHLGLVIGGFVIASFVAGWSAYGAIRLAATPDLGPPPVQGLPANSADEENREQWVRSAPPASCRAVCSAPLRPVAAGQDDSGQMFFICRSAARRDERPGFNVDTNNTTTNKCAILADGKPAYELIYDCLCLTGV